MNMALLSELLTEALQPALTYQVPDVELPSDWDEFETQLAKYKLLYKEALTQLRRKENEFSVLASDLSVLQSSVTAIQDSLMQTEISNMIEKYKHDHGYDALKSETAKLAGKVRAMERVLVHTNARNFSQFTCSICMERPVDTFMDPCGHMFCEACVLRVRNIHCPTCRTQFVPKKIYI